MTNTTSQVHDLIYPSPITLKEISAITLVVELWREEIEHSKIKTKNELDLADNILLKEVIPNVPSAIYDLLDKFITNFRSSIAQWLKYHSMKVFGPHYNSLTKLEKLKNFHDFEWDWSCSIDYVRTAKRMMLCDRLTNDEKFKTACLYCFEDDIRRIWPFVSSDMDLVRIDFHQCPLLYYWICNLRGEQQNAISPYDEPIDEVMLDSCDYQNYSSTKYFWNRIPYERQSLAAFDVSVYASRLFARFILPRLDDLQLTVILTKGGVDLMVSLIMTPYDIEKIHVLPTWMHIRNIMNRSDFIRLIEKLLKEETMKFIHKEKLNFKDKVSLCCEIWKHPPENLTQLELNDVLLNEELFNRTRRGSPDPREMRFLITLLLDASFDLRHAFWCKNWCNLISGARVEHLQRVMKLCFRNENDMSLFKEQSMSKYENVGPYCIQLLKRGCYKELSELLSFCYSDQQKIREVKQQLLRSIFLNYSNTFWEFWYNSFLHHSKQLNAFIEDAFETSDLRADCKNQFFPLSKIQDYIFSCIRLGYFGCFIEIIEAFVQDEQAVIVLKQHLLDNFKERLISGDIWRVNDDDFQKILGWLQGSEDEIGEFKQSLSAGDIFCNMIQLQLQHVDKWDPSGKYNGPIEYPHRPDDFLKWFFNNDAEEIRKIKEQYSDKLKLLQCFAIQYSIVS